MVLQYVGMLFPFCMDSDSSFQKKDKESGRIIGDVSNDANHNALNDENEFVANTARNLWDDIRHPTIS
jgi:hypothetical protein